MRLIALGPLAHEDYIEMANLCGLGKCLLQLTVERKNLSVRRTHNLKAKSYPLVRFEKGPEKLKYKKIKSCNFAKYGD